jgi:hypothetical protein
MSHLAMLSPLEEALLKQGAVKTHCFSAASTQGPRVWYVLALFLMKEAEFEKAVQKQGTPVNLKDYGFILASGIGDHPPESVMQAIKERYGIDFDKS